MVDVRDFRPKEPETPEVEQLQCPECKGLFFLYYFRSPDWFEAVCARKSAEKRYGYHQNHGRTAKQFRL